MALKEYDGNGSFLRRGVLLGVWRNIEVFPLMVYILHGSLNDLWTDIIVSIITNTITHSTEAISVTLLPTMYLIPASSKWIHLYSHRYRAEKDLIGKKSNRFAI